MSEQTAARVGHFGLRASGSGLRAPGSGLQGRWGFAVIALAALAVGGCSSPAHLSDSYARTSRRAFERQAVLEPGAEAAKPVSGLDSQEAATVSDSYRKSLAPKGTQKVEDEMIYIAPKKDGVQMRAIMPPPSVPQAERH